MSKPGSPRRHAGMLDVSDLPVIYTAWRNRYHDRDNRMELIDRVITGDFGVFDPEDEPIESRSPNFVQVALEDTAEAASLMPTLRVEPSGTTSGAKKRAVTMEKVGTSYLDISKMDLLVPQTVMDMAAFGYGVWVVWPRFDLRAPVIERRDPRTCYPELGHRPGDPVERAFFCRQVPYTSLPENYKITLSNYLANTPASPRWARPSRRTSTSSWWSGSTRRRWSSLPCTRPAAP
jgi:hypothetical protein